MVESRKACDVTRGCSLVPNAFLVNSPSLRAVNVGGRLRNSGDDSHGLNLEVGIRVNPHIGVLYISEDIGNIVMYVTLVMGPGPVI